jgi:hypothetical protein
MLSRPPHYIAIVVVPMMDARLLAELWDQEKEERAEKENKKRTRRQHVYESTLFKVYGRVKQLLHNQAHADQKKDGDNVMWSR